MKITRVETIVLAASLDDQAFGFSFNTSAARQSCVVVVHTDEGVTGIGEAFFVSGPAKIVATYIDEGLTPHLLGCDPRETAVLWHHLYSMTRDQGMKGLAISAISAIDLALHDIKGKALGISVSNLLGGRFRESAKVYATGLYEPLHIDDVESALVEEGKGYVARGFCGMKLKIGYGIETDTRYVEALRSAIGNDVKLMVDANHAYTAAEAAQLLPMLEENDVFWFEEPVIPEDLDGYVELRGRSRVLIAGGECEYTRFGFREVINRRAVDILQPDLCAVGGFTEMMAIAAMANAANLTLYPHVWGTNIGLAASLQAYAALAHTPQRRYPHEPLFELDQSPHPFRDAVSEETFDMEQGYVSVPDRPGLGITFDRDAVDKFRV